MNIPLLHKTGTFTYFLISHTTDLFPSEKKSSFMTTEPTLVQVFGAGATQDATTLTIQKSALAGVGLTPAANNTAESLLTGVILQAKSTLTASNHDANIDQSITIAEGYLPTFVIRNDAQYRQDTVTVAFEKPAGSTVIDPDDY